ncbi:MAG: hypothetical protein PHV20_01785 [Bacteroidales bacterium]|nr:hypothetical protein [Bacteroidales bacterium]
MKNSCLKLIVAMAYICLSQYAFGASKRSQITQYGITWIFDKPMLAGQYITGDWWVQGPVKVVSVSPTPGSVASDTTRITLNHWNDTSLSRDTSMRNGSMIATKPTEKHGYDSRNQLYDAKMSVRFPMVLQPNQTLISTESNVNLPVDNFCKECVEGRDSTVKTVLKSAAVLTCVEQVPSEDAFRPSYVGGDRREFRLRDIAWRKLPKLALPDSVPSWSKMERYFDRPWLDHLLTWQQQEIVPNENEPNYGREQARLVSMASLMLMLDVPQKQKEKLTIELIQRGIDLYGIAMVGGFWNEGGGHSSGRKWPILFASIMLNRPELAKLPESAVFQEDAQTYYGKGWFGQTALWQMIKHHGERDTYEEKRPDEWAQWDKTSESYRLCCTSSAWVGTALAAYYMNAQELWGHDAFFDYVERWMRVDDPYRDARGIYKRSALEGKAKDPFVTHMWKMYRAKAPKQQKSNKNLKWIWDGKVGKMVVQ